MTLHAMEFLRRFLQHVLPAGFQKVGHYGFLSPNSATAIEAVRWLVTWDNGAVFTLLASPDVEPAAKAASRCPCAAVSYLSRDSRRPGCRLSLTRASPMVALSHFLRHCVALCRCRGPVEVRPDVGFTTVCGYPQAELVAQKSRRDIPTRSSRQQSSAGDGPFPPSRALVHPSRPEALPKSGLCGVVAGLLEHRLEVRLRGLQSIMVRPRLSHSEPPRSIDHKLAYRMTLTIHLGTPGKPKPAKSDPTQCPETTRITLSDVC
jgi:hypothetical protein